ncbi:MAG: glycerophosphodiester phosphodiesterase [Anaerolineae bacterium]|nr:glycerophosphodiester phosphodiesterase [Anaerolineae bacterium]
MYETPYQMIFAHRGSSLYAPENTLPAFQRAVDDGADAVELDVKLTADQKVVVIHDQMIDRTTDGSGNVADMTLEELRQFDAGSWFSDQFHGIQIPTLEDVFGVVGREVYINIELTNYRTPNDSLVPAVVELVKKHKMIENVMFSSFLPKNLYEAKQHLPEVLVAILALPGIKGILSRGYIGRRAAPSVIHPYLTDVNAAFVKRQHSIGRRVNVWTVNMAEDIQRLFDMGVDGIFTDDPPLALRVLGRSG